MRLTQDTLKEKGRLVADDGRYRIYDYDLDDLTVSVTELKKGQETRGHSHDSNAEVYFFPGGKAVMEVGRERFRIGRGTVLIPKGEFHRVANKSKTTDLLFISVFSGKREQAHTKYGGNAKVPRGHRISSPRQASRQS